MTTKSKKSLGNPLLERLKKTLLVAPRDAHIEFACASACYRALSLHDEWAFARLADYVTERVGVSMGAWYDAIHAGNLLLQSTPCRDAYRQGQISLTALTLMSRNCSPPEAEALLSTASEIPTADLRRLIRDRKEPRAENPDPGVGESRGKAAQSEQPNLVDLRLRLPRSVASYCEDTIELANAISGHSLPQPAALSCVLAEASTELNRAPDQKPRAHKDLLARPRISRANNSSRSRCSLNLPGPRSRRTVAVELDAILRRERTRIVQLKSRGEDLLLDALQSDLHGQLGHPGFPQFAREYFGISRSRLYEMLHQARLRRVGDPIARARSRGDISSVRANLLSELPRMGVPRSALADWIRHAAQTTVRMLRRLLAWARRVSRTDMLAWSRAAYAPPTERQVRTTESPIGELARNPDPRLRIHVTTEPCESVHWSLEADDHCLLLELVAALEASMRTRGARRPPLWYSILRLFHFARVAWAQLECIMPRHPHREVLERDRYECQVPGCRQRAVEVHHIHYAGRGGSDEASNLLCLCPYHHRQGEHAGRVRIRGRVTPDRAQLTFELGTLPAGSPLLRYRGEMMLPTSGQAEDSRSLCPA